MRCGTTAARRHCPPVVTVLLPHRDMARYLGAAVGSVLGQDLVDLRLVVVDDCSPRDDWLAALRPYAADPRLTVLRTADSVGQARIKNALLPGIASPYVAFQDADDVSLPGRLRRQVRVLERGRADLVGCAIEEVDEDGAVLRRRRLPRYGNLALRLGRLTVLHHPATVVRTAVLDRLGGLDGTTTLGADTDFHLRAGHLFRLRNLPRVLYRYRIWGRSLTRAPGTGFGSPVREAYTAAMRERERARRRARSPGELAPLLLAPPNDRPVELLPVVLHR
ncbi:hypothetical protein GCM10010123_40680 [Pilimelia anulata]|uniref:Glycosyltransferase 2-like domain-containing protein n=1 Tax=Pilimelia anulata TaxID=53371 RepID=A0A8J3BAM9_9ACTN|nr:glycosyltransferase family 2 protein [Pilimelia anulata]GGK06788.1 hypothetical protein GCM10010123_40680 [Pilimelia anulata]